MPGVALRILAADDWAIFRAVRLRSLADAPYAFSATLADAQRRSEAGWREGLAARVQIVAEEDGAVVGTVGMHGDAQTPGAAEMISMWVAPEARGRGVGEQLVRALVAAARDGGWREVRAWITEGNDFAERLYARCGFARTGEVQAMGPEAPDRREFAMALAVPPP